MTRTSLPSLQKSEADAPATFEVPTFEIAADQGIGEKMLDIAPRSREKIIDAKDLVPSRQELLAEMGAKKSSASGN